MSDYDNYFEECFVEEEITLDTPDKYLILVIYDITENKLRTNLAKYLLGFGVRVQKSAFECLLTESQYQRFLKGIRPFIKDQKDRLFIYKINTRAEVTRFGETELPILDDIIIL